MISNRISINISININTHRYISLFFNYIYSSKSYIAHLIKKKKERKINDEIKKRKKKKEEETTSFRERGKQNRAN